MSQRLTSTSGASRKVPDVTKRFESVKVEHILLAAILIVATFLRFFRITERGIWDYDEAWYLLETKSLYDTIQYAFQSITNGDFAGEGLKSYLRARGDAPVTAFKPGHNVLVLVGMLLLGVHDYATLSVSALSGTLTVLVTYLLASKMFDKRVGLLAALILAVSTFHVGHSRSGYAQANGVLFTTLGLYLWYGFSLKKIQQWGYLFGAGAAIGIGFTCHFNLFTLPPLIVAYEILWQQRTNVAMRDGFRRLATLGAGMAAPLLAFELPVRLLRAMNVLPDGHQTYYEQFAYRGTLTSKLHFNLDGVEALAEKLWLAEGPLVVLGLLAGTWMAIRGFRQLELTMAVALFLIPALPWTTLSVGLPPLYRTFAIQVIPCAILAAYGLDWIATRIRSNLSDRFRPAVLPITVIALLAIAGTQVGPLMAISSGYRAATDQWIDYAKNHGGTISIQPGSSWPIWYFYLSSRYDELPSDVKNQIQFYPGGSDLMPPPGDYDVLDGKRMRRVAIGENRALESYLSRLQGAKVVARIPNSAAVLHNRYSEAWEKNTSTYGPTKQSEKSPGYGYTTVYDIRSSGIKQLAKK